MDVHLSPRFQIERGTEKDVSVVHDLVRSLAQFERLSDEVSATPERIRNSLFGVERGAEVLIGYADGKPAGFAAFFQTYSTFLAQPGLYLEDLFVQDEWRGKGLGRQLLASVARIAVERGCGRLEWSVLNWNEDAIRFYENLGARAMNEWTGYRLTGAPLEQLANRLQSDILDGQ